SSCNFTSANISKAVFESTNLSRSEFSRTKAVGTNFFYADMRSVIIRESNFQRAFMRGSDGTKLTEDTENSAIETTNLDFSNIRHGKWDHVKVSDSSLNYADLEGVSLAHASLRRVSMQHAILNRAILRETELIKT